MRGGWTGHRKLARLWRLRLEAEVCSAVILGDWRLWRGRLVWNYVDVGLRWLETTAAVEWAKNNAGGFARLI